MLKFPFAEFDWLYQYKREYNDGPRGDMTKMFTWVKDYEPGKYDVAILHLDQQCIEPDILAIGKGSVYRQLNEVIKDVPKIVIMHGTPYYPEEFTSPQEIIDKVNELVGDNYLIVNSHRALNQWGWQDNPRARTIIHGMDPAEWFDLPKEPRVITMISPGGLPAYYDRPFLNYIKEGLQEEGVEHCHITVDFMARSFNEYRDFLGRSLIYVNPTKESPMPRARTEAMLSGCCVLTTPSQDADTFIKNGVNGFLIPRNPKAVVDLCLELLNDYKRTVAIGQAGKATAKQLFGMARYQNEWQDYLNFVMADWKSKH
jgi:glycosyltransferase involved in cell wall biosynthesis